ncbi:MAG: phytanoyl-CoA dioxygenase family protein [bacterium]|nr:phytanoyl-CoA dioxygenase family protein [bacterium]
MLPDGFSELDFDEYHQVELPRLLAEGNGALAFAEVKRRGSLAFRIAGGSAYTYTTGSNGIDILPGDETARTVLELSHEAWQEIVHEIQTAPGLLYRGEINCLRGKAIRLVVWEPALRAIYNGRPIFNPEEFELTDRHGAPLDPATAFTLDDDRTDMTHFLRNAGYLVVKRVFSAQEVSLFQEQAEELRRTAVQGDRKSWWGKNAAGDSVLCRVTNAGRADSFRGLYRDPRITGLIDLSDTKLESRGEKAGDDCATVIFKNPDMAEGLSNLPWHRDCGMGGHALNCPLIITSTFVQPLNEQTGELRMLPGSQNGSCVPIDADDPKAPRGVAIAAEPGDVSLHYGDCMHAAPTPRGHGPGTYRISALTSFIREGARSNPRKGAYNDVLLGRDDGQVEHLSDVAAQEARQAESG